MKKSLEEAGLRAKEHDTKISTQEAGGDNVSNPRGTWHSLPDKLRSLRDDDHSVMSINNQ